MVNQRNKKVGAKRKEVYHEDFSGEIKERQIK